jgi:hypothetical protein
VFDFRYHVASLAAVLVALIIGILVGVGLSGQGFVTDSERAALEGDIAGLRRALDGERARADRLERGQRGDSEFAQAACCSSRTDCGGSGSRSWSSAPSRTAA